VSASIYADIVFDRAVRRAFTYRLPADSHAKIGCRVIAPLNRKPTVGIIVKINKTTELDEKRVLDIETVLDTSPVLTEEILELCAWIASYYHCALGEACFAAYPFNVNSRHKSESVIVAAQPSGKLLAAADELENGRGATQAKVLREVASDDYQPCTASSLAKRLSISAGPIQALRKRGFLAVEERIIHRRPAGSDPLFRYDAPELNPQQKEVLQKINRAFHDERFAPFLLFGVTGSGKTEVYIKAIETALAAGKTAMVLVPEISLTPQAVERYRSRLGERVGILHSGLSAGERYDEWKRALSGELQVVVGTRSAVFAPIKNLGLVVVDEEHDDSYKQDDPAPRYHGRDVAMMRARKASCPIVLGSATPALESFYNVQRNKYVRLDLPNRAVEHNLPEVKLVDMRGHDPETGPLCDELCEAMESCLTAGGQAILFLNRRGFSPNVLCTKCGHIIQCPNCSVAMVYHRARHGLLCHHCDYFQNKPNACPECNQEWIEYRGVGTEQLTEWVQENFESIAVQRMDMDTTRGKNAHDKILAAFRRREIDVLVGTQMISKGLDMPGVTLVGVVDADIGLAMPDFRSAERTFALLTQVAGRAGRGEHAGNVVIQSHCPKHYAVELALAHDYVSFFRKEYGFRKMVQYPPHCRMALIRVDCKDAGETRRLSRKLARVAKQVEIPSPTPLRILGPAEAPISRVKNRYRWQLAVMHPSYRAIAKMLNDAAFQRACTTELKLGARVSVDVDPVSLL
jgi:primosomal protein N' (replication factor Y) (superfamily II helicase)